MDQPTLHVTRLCWVYRTTVVLEEIRNLFKFFEFQNFNCWHPCWTSMTLGHRLILLLFMVVYRLELAIRTVLAISTAAVLILTSAALPARHHFALWESHWTSQIVIAYHRPDPLVSHRSFLGIFLTVSIGSDVILHCARLSLETLSDSDWSW